MGHHHHHHHGPLDVTGARWSAVGALLGMLALASVLYVSPEDLHNGVSTFLRTLSVLVLETAPALIVGYALAGIVPFLLTQNRTAALARGSRVAQSLRGVAFGLPLPVCSCGVLPLYESLIRRGAPATAALAFFVATPELGLDAVLLSVPLLGSSLTIARVTAAFLVAMLVALLVAGRTPTPRALPRDAAAVATTAPWTDRIRAGLRFGFVELLDHTLPWIALGLVIAAAAEPLLAHGSIAHLNAAVQVPLAALVGVPMYVCASGATPIAALAIHKGLSSGAAIAFLIAGPATNVTTFGVLTRLHGRRAAATFGITVTAMAVLAGWSIDALGVAAMPVLDARTSGHSHGSWFAWGCVVALAGLTIASLVRQGPRGALQQIFEPIH
ncbi:MAG: hypothetical protein B7733_26160 [Myxococcales bacterium FL481]|nr:MAG: hypothetical protein B7733_26160 [Myxococcales bacterium FL481]